MGEAKGAEQNAINVSVFGVSDMGRVRKNNEDNFVVCDLTTGEVGLTLHFATTRWGIAVRCLW